MNHPERIAIIDCGTNTFNLLIADVFEGGWKTIFTTKIAVKLGIGGFGQGVIRPERMARAIDALRSHSNTLLNFGVKKHLTFATSALREAENGKELVNDAKSLFGLDIRIIDGDKEAELIYKGVTQSIDFESATWTIIDIGGGSTEFIICTKDEILWKASFQLGVSRLFEQLEPDDPILPEQVERLFDHVKTVLAPLENALSKIECHKLIGSSGSFDSVLSLLAQNHPDRYVRDEAKSHALQINDFIELHNQLLISTRNERLKMKGLQPIRADYIVLATLLITYVLKELGFTELWQSEYALKEGAIWEAIYE
jgi:exopolyphosphatase / guanosine-5'-triphosphate,3'-diphosphate pyrophosphatase